MTSRACTFFAHFDAVPSGKVNRNPMRSTGFRFLCAKDKISIKLNITALTPRASLGNHNIWYRTVRKRTKYLSSSRWSISQRCRLAGAAGILRWSWFSARIVQHLRLQGKNINCHSSFLTGKTDLHFPEGFLKCLLSWLNLLKKDDLQSLSIYFTVARPVLLNVFK